MGSSSLQGRVNTGTSSRDTTTTWAQWQVERWLREDETTSLDTSLLLIQLSGVTEQSLEPSNGSAIMELPCGSIAWTGLFFIAYCNSCLSYPRQSIVLNIVREEITINETLKL